MSGYVAWFWIISDSLGSQMPSDSIVQRYRAALRAMINAAIRDPRLPIASYPCLLRRTALRTTAESVALDPRTC